MTDAPRGTAIRRRRLAAGIKSLREFEEQTGVSRPAITNAEKGEASESTFQRLETWLEKFEAETGIDDADAGLVEFRLSGNFGVDVVVRGPVSDLAELEKAVGRLMRNMGEKPAK